MIGAEATFETASQTFGELVAAEVRAMMARRRVTGEVVAAKLGKSRAYVSRRLHGETCLDLDDLATVADALGVSIESLVAPAIAELDRQQRSGVRPAIAGVGESSREMHIPR